MKLLRLTNNYLSVQPLPRKTEFDFLLPSSSEETQRWGIVEMAGPGIPDCQGEMIPPVVTPGKLVYMMLHGQESITDPLMREVTDTILISEFDVMGMADPIYDGDDNLIGMENFDPLGSLCLIEKIESAPEYEDILLPGSYKTPANAGIVLRVGRGWLTTDRKPVPLQVKEGETVLFRPYNPLEVKLNLLGLKGQLYMIDHQDIFGVIQLPTTTRTS